MREVYTKEEIENLEKAEKLLQEKGRGEAISMFNFGPDHEYSLNFKVKDKVLANYALGQLLFHSKDGREDVPNIGIEVTSINMNAATGLDQMASELHNAIDNIISKRRG